MQIRYTKNWKFNKQNRGYCHGHCSYCRGYPKTTTHKPGYKKMIAKEFRYELLFTLQDLDY